MFINWQTKKYRPEMSIWYRIALLLKHNSRLTFKLSTARSSLNESVAEKTDSRVRLDRGHVIKLIHSQNTLNHNNLF